MAEWARSITCDCVGSQWRASLACVPPSPLSSRTRRSRSLLTSASEGLGWSYSLWKQTRRPAEWEQLTGGVITAGHYSCVTGGRTSNRAPPIPPLPTPITRPTNTHVIGLPSVCKIGQISQDIRRSKFGFPAENFCNRIQYQIAKPI